MERCSYVWLADASPSIISETSDVLIGRKLGGEPSASAATAFGSEGERRTRRHCVATLHAPGVAGP